MSPEHEAALRDVVKYCPDDGGEDCPCDFHFDCHDMREVLAELDRMRVAYQELMSEADAV